MEYKDYSYYQEKFKEEEDKKSGAEIMLWIFGFIIISTIMINITENQLDISIKGFLKFIPIIILTSAFFLRKRKFLVGVFLIVSFGLYGRHIHKLSSPYSYLDIEIPDRGNSLDINNSILVQGSCTNFLSKEEGINCIDDLHQWLENHDDKVLMDSINILKEQFSNHIENVNDYTDKLNTYIEYANKIQRISPELALSYYEKGLEIAKKSNQQTFISIFYYYIVVENYLLKKYTAIQTIDELQKLYRVTSNPNLKQVANYTSLQIKKNTYNLTQDEYDKILEYGRNGDKKSELKSFQFLFKILQGDYLTQNVFFQLARNTYAEALTQENEIEDEIKGILGRYYERLGNAYYNKGAAERAVFFLNKKRELGELGLGIGDNVIDLFIPNIQCNQEKLSIKWAVQRDINSEKLLVNSMLLFHYFHDKNTYKSNISKIINFLEKALSNEDFPSVIKRELLYNLARYYNLEENKKKAIKGLKAMNEYSNSYMEIADYHYQLSTYYYYELNNLDKAIKHSDKCFEYYGTDYENFPRFTKDYSFETLFTPFDKQKERMVNTKENARKDIVVGYQVGKKRELYRAASTNQTILTSYERALMHLNIFTQKNDIKELIKAYLYADYSMRNIQDIWGCTSCESDKNQLATLYFDIIDLYINLAHSMIMYVTPNDNVPIFEGIFNAIELMKSNVALEGINKNYMSFLGAESDLKSKIKQIDFEISNIDKEIEKNNVDKGKISRLESQKFKLFSQKESFMTEISTKYPEYFLTSTLVVDDRYSNLLSLMNLLQPDECFINYYQSPKVNKLYAMIINKNDVSIQDIPLFYEIELDLETKEGVKVKKTISELDSDLGERIGKKRLLNDMALLNSFLKNGNTKEDEKLNELLYTMNLSFLDRLIPPNTYKTLYISKHGVVNAIPFDLLLEEEVNGSYDDLPYLFKKYNIVSIPSGFSFNTLKMYKENNQLKSPNQLLNIAPFYNTLENSLKSSEAVYNFLNKKMPKHSISLINEKATAKNVKELLPQYNILNFSTHGVLDTTENMKSKLLLSPSGSSENKDLYLYELFTMQLNSKLTVLSACETNLGEMKGVGGINSFVNAFHYAGCPTVVGTSWKVNDKTTGELMEYFYSFLQEGKTVSESLRQAKLKYLSQKRRTAEYHPYYWGGFMVSGDGNMTFNFD